MRDRIPVTLPRIVGCISMQAIVVAELVVIMLNETGIMPMPGLAHFAYRTMMIPMPITIAIAIGVPTREKLAMLMPSRADLVSIGSVATAFLGGMAILSRLIVTDGRPDLRTAAYATALVLISVSTGWTAKMAFVRLGGDAA